METKINLPEVVAEVTGAFMRYDAALTSNDIAVLDELFWDHPSTLRYGVGENLVGYQTIRAFRLARLSQGLERDLMHIVITTYCRNYTTANTEFTRKGEARIGRQSHTWLRLPQGWRIVTAHVSLMTA